MRKCDRFHETTVIVLRSFPPLSRMQTMIRLVRLPSCSRVERELRVGEGGRSPLTHMPPPSRPRSVTSVIGRESGGCLPMKELQVEK